MNAESQTDEPPIDPALLRKMLAEAKSYEEARPILVRIVAAGPAAIVDEAE